MAFRRLLDLFCGVGGASTGYHAAGFAVVGVDIEPQPDYPFPFWQADALTFPLVGFDVVHASPPCQAHTTLRARFPETEYPELVGPIRERLKQWGGTYVIENVPGAPLIDPVVLCGSMFELGCDCADGRYRQLRRHRLFESNVPLRAPRSCDHCGQPVGIYGTGGAGDFNGRYKGTTREYQEAQQVTWTSNRRSLSQAIPPAYTAWIGRQL